MSVAERVWLDLAQATEYTLLSERTLKTAIYNGDLKTSQNGPGGRHLLHRDWLDEYLRNRSKTRRRPRKAAS